MQDDHQDSRGWFGSAMPSTIGEVLARAASLFTDRYAVVEGNSALTYSELFDSARRTAKGLISLGINSGDRVAIWAPNSTEWIAVSYAAYLIGAILVPLNTRYTLVEATQILNTSSTRLLLTSTDFLGVNYAEAIRGAVDVATLEQVISISGPPVIGTLSWQDLIDMGTCITDFDLEARSQNVDGNDVSDIIFTSGTTGAPKGAMLRHEASIRTYLAWSNKVGLRDGDRYFSVYPYFHTAGLKSVLLACALFGATVYPLPTFDVEEVFKIVEHQRITMLPGPPTMFQMILDSPLRHQYDLSSVRTSVTGAATIPVELIRRMREELRIPSVVTAYGLTESTGTVSVCDADDPPEVIAHTVGKPIPGVVVRIVDEEGNECSMGVAGEVTVRGFNVITGYFNNDEATRASIKDGWLYTGDVGLLDADGNLRITDRKKDMFIVGGFNAYPAEIEGVLTAHPDVSQVAVVGLPHARLGETGTAFVIPKPTCESEPSDILAWAHQRLAKFKLSRVIFVDSLPTGPSGKIQKFKLRELYGQSHN